MAKILGWFNKSIPFVRRHHVSPDALLKPNVLVGDCRDADEHNVDFAVIENFESTRLRQFDVLTYIARELVDRDAETCMGFMLVEPFRCLQQSRRPRSRMAMQSGWGKVRGLDSRSSEKRKPFPRFECNRTQPALSLPDQV